MYYLDRKDIESLYSGLSEEAKKDGEIMPSFSIANLDDIDALVSIPQRSLFGSEQYPTLEAKAAIIFYTVNKKHIFLNGNKRMSTACLLVFLIINKKVLNVVNDELTEKAIWLAKTATKDFQEIKADLEGWIKDGLKDFG